MGTYQKPVKKVTAVITPHKHFGLETGFKEKLVFVIKGQEHPDPAKKLTWGRDNDGPIAGDWNGNFEKAGNPIKLEVDVTKAFTAHEEKVLVLQAIDEYIAAYFQGLEVAN